MATATKTQSTARTAKGNAGNKIPAGPVRKSTRTANASANTAAEETETKGATRAGRRGVDQANVTEAAPKQNTGKTQSAADTNDSGSTNSRTINMTDEQREKFLQGKREAAQRFKERRQFAEAGKPIPSRLALRVSRKDEEVAEVAPAKGKAAAAKSVTTANRSKATAKAVVPAAVGKAAGKGKK